MTNKLIILVLLVISCNPTSKITDIATNQFPHITEKVRELPTKEISTFLF